ncbi:MAG: cobalt ECF transporter T component CbiQ [Oscillochloridaceae bacterium umkhey_bin13]
MTLTPEQLDRYIVGQSPIHTLDARVKLVLTLTCILTMALLPPGAWVALFAYALLIWAATLRSGVGLTMIMSRSLVALPFALVAVTLVFSRTGEPLWRFALGPLELVATDAGLVAFLSVLVRSWLSVQAALLLTATTHFTEVLAALRALRLPPVLVAILGFAYRYLFVMVDEAQRMLRARACRSATVPGQRAGGSLAWRAAVVGQMAGTLFLRAYERSERIYAAMLARGYQGELRTLGARPLTSAEQGILLLGIGLLAAVVFLAYLF